MKRLVILTITLFSMTGGAAEKDVSGEVTYVTSNSVYTSLGRNEGVNDSTMLYVISGADTTATLRVFATSSRSSACRILSSVNKPSTGDRVVGTIEIAESNTEVATGTVQAGTWISAPVNPVPGYDNPRTFGESEPFEVSGRISGQFFGTFHDQPANNVSQPGIAAKVKVKSTEIPVTFDMYANFRSLTIGSDGPFSGNSRNQSRIHRVALDYNDGTYKVSLGRFAPGNMASIGYVDGLMLGTTLGNFSVGVVGGFQPSASQRSISTDYTKFGLFANYYPDGAGANRITMAYTRRYFLSDLDRESASVGTSLALNSSLTLYAHADVDLRKKSGGSIVYSPQLSQLFVNARYRIIRPIAVGVGANATRPLYPYSTLRTMPEDLVNTEIRGGLSFSLYLYLPAGISFTNTYTPRTSNNNFADNYTEYAALTVPNIASSGLTVRTNFNLNASDYTTSRGYGVSLFRNMWQLFNVTLRYQQYDYTVQRIDQTNQSATIGADLMIPISRMFSIMSTFEQYESTGLRTNTVFAELTVRF